MSKHGEQCFCVIGAGIIGSWTALHLAQSGIRTVLVEQFPLPHTRGSSHGGSRVIRLMGDDKLAALEYSYEKWRELEKISGEQLMATTGLINLGPPGDRYLHKYMKIMREGGYSTQWLDEEQLKARYPFLKYPGLGAATDPKGAVLLAHKCVSGVQRMFKRYGGKIVTGKVEEIVPKSRSVCIRVRVNTTSQIRQLEFSRVAVCAGPWSSKLLPKCAHLLSTQRIPVTYWKERNEPYRHSVASGFPVIFNARLANVYAVPSFEYPGLVKVLTHSGPAATPEQRDCVDLDASVEYLRFASFLSCKLPPHNP